MRPLSIRDAHSNRKVRRALPPALTKTSESDIYIPILLAHSQLVFYQRKLGLGAMNYVQHVMNDNDCHVWWQKQQSQLKQAMDDFMRKSDAMHQAKRSLETKRQQDSSVVEQLRVIVAEKETKIHSLELQVCQLQQVHWWWYLWITYTRFTDSLLVQWWQYIYWSVFFKLYYYRC